MAGIQSTPGATSTSGITSDNSEDTAHPLYAVRIQSGRFHDDDSWVGAVEMNRLLTNDLVGRITEVGDGIAADLFPDEAFGFPINDQFVKNFCGSFISSGKLFDPDNFETEQKTAIFLNRMVATIAHFLKSTKKTSLVPLRYFTDAHSKIPVDAYLGKVKPDVLIAPLLDGCIREGPIDWKDVKSIIELTREKKPPTRMAKTVSVKGYLTFCHQPDRDFIPFLCITRTGIHIVVTDHVGHIETDAIPFTHTATTLVIFRMIMGMIFLPNSHLGMDATMFRRDDGVSSGRKFSDVYQHFEYKVNNPRIQLFASDPSICTNPSTTTFNYDETGDYGIAGISVNSTTYPVIRLIFRTQTLIGRATRAFLVRLPDGSLGVIKDSWITTERAAEATFIQGLDIPFGPKLIDHCILRNTGTFRDNPITKSSIMEHREKRRVVTYPAGVHISDFSSLWELMVAMLDVVVAITYLESKQKLHRDISYTNILLREPGIDSATKTTVRKDLMESLGLSDIEELRKELNCREGLLIDFDYGALISDLTTHDRVEHVSEDCESGKVGDAVDGCSDEYHVVLDADQALQSIGEETQDSCSEPAPIPNYRKPAEPSGGRTGTAPFIAIELLIHGTSHRVVHDLESLLYVLLFICTHLDGPSRQIRDPPLYGSDRNSNHPSSMKMWLETNKLSSLGHVKFSHMMSHFDSHILSKISPYFFPLKDYIKGIWKALIPQRETMASVGEQAAHSTATAQDIINVLKTALQDRKLIDAHLSAPPSVLGKRSAPGDLFVGSGWDPAKESRALRTANPRVAPRPRRRTKFMERR